MNQSSWLFSRIVCVALGLLTLLAADDAYAAAEGERCGRAGSWSSTCDEGLACEVGWSFWNWSVGECVAAPRADECTSDEECLHGYCDSGVTCAAIGCPPPPPNRCTVCGDGTQLLCRRAFEPCPAGLAREIVNSCYGECVDRFTCESAGACEYDGAVYQVGDSFKASDGCNDCNCSADGTVACTLKLCVCDYSDPARDWKSKDPEECTRLDYQCSEGTRPFTDQACGCGCEPAGTCDYDGAVYNVGDSFKSADGCNDCNCSAGGLVACTEKFCVCDYSDPARDWKSKDPEECTRLDYQCPEGTRPFTDQACGCGCEPAGTCEYNGVVYQVGDSFKDADGCNDCNCNAGGLAACTLKLCL